MKQLRMWIAGVVMAGALGLLAPASVRAEYDPVLEAIMDGYCDGELAEPSGALYDYNPQLWYQLQWLYTEWWEDQLYTTGEAPSDEASAAWFCFEIVPYVVGG